MSDKVCIKFTNKLIAQGAFVALKEVGKNIVDDENKGWDFTLFLVELQEHADKYGAHREAVMKNHMVDIRDPATGAATGQKGILPGSKEHEAFIKAMEPVDAKEFTVSMAKPIFTKKDSKGIAPTTLAAAAPFLDMRRE